MLKRMAHFLTLKQLVATSAVLVTCACDRIEPAFAPAEAEVNTIELTLDEARSLPGDAGDRARNRRFNKIRQRNTPRFRFKPR